MRTACLRMMVVRNSSSMIFRCKTRDHIWSSVAVVQGMSWRLCPFLAASYSLQPTTLTLWSKIKGRAQALLQSVRISQTSYNKSGDAVLYLCRPMWRYLCTEEAKLNEVCRWCRSGPDSKWIWRGVEQVEECTGWDFWFGGQVKARFWYSKTPFDCVAFCTASADVMCSLYSSISSCFLSSWFGCIGKEGEFYTMYEKCFERKQNK